MQAIILAQVCFTSWSDKCVVAPTCGQSVTVYITAATEAVIVTEIYITMRSSESRTIDLILGSSLLSREVQTRKQRSNVRYVPKSALALSFILVDMTIIQAVVERLGS